MSSRPASPPSWSRIDAVIDASSAPAEYAHWLAQLPPASDDYLFSEARVRFAARESDRLVAPADLRVSATARGVELASARLGGSLEVEDVSHAAVERWCAAFDGQTSCRAVLERTRASKPVFFRFVQATLGRVLFASEAISKLEARISGSELVRFVNTPYELERSYWENMADVRDTIALALAEVHDVASFVRALQRLHVIALLGRELDNFYRPASRVAGRAVQPGALYRSESRVEGEPDDALLVEGPRVGVPLVGGARYHALLCAHDPAALSSTRQLSDAEGLAWGVVVQGRAPSESEKRAWFVPPRPQTQAHFERLFEAHRQATHGPETECVSALARFHFRFVRLHPFRCANQSLAMNLTNAALEQRLGVSMPHGLLDQFALRMSEHAYERLFARAVRYTSSTATGGERWAQLRQRKAKAYEFIERLKNADSDAEAEALCQTQPEGARAALVID